MLDIARDQGGLVDNAGGGDEAIVPFQMKLEKKQRTVTNVDPVPEEGSETVEMSLL
jgi:hypothetical protein